MTDNDQADREMTRALFGTQPNTDEDPATQTEEQTARKFIQNLFNQTD